MPAQYGPEAVPRNKYLAQREVLDWSVRLKGVDSPQRHLVVPVLEDVAWMNPRRPTDWSVEVGRVNRSEGGGRSRSAEPVDLMIANIGELLVCPPGGLDLGLIPNAVVAVRDGRVAWVGPARRASAAVRLGPETVVFNAGGRVVMPGLVECHTHLGFAGHRAAEFQARVAGWSYDEIAAGGGGVLATVRATRTAHREQLLRNVRCHLDTMLGFGITTVEAKSGYGLTVEDELRLLEVYREVDRSHAVDIVPTLLAAHVVPMEYRGRPDRYVDLVVEEIIPEVAQKRLATFCDVYCDQGFFDLDHSRRILEAARANGMLLTLHGDQMADSGGAVLAAELEAVSASRLEQVGEEGIERLAEAGVVAQLLPGTRLSLGRSEFAPARRLMDNGVKVALSTDFNPGTCYTENLWLMGTMASCYMHMDVTEVVRALTCHAAASLSLDTEVGSLQAGHKADVVVLDMDDHLQIPYHFGINPVRAVFKNGTLTVDHREKRTQL
ncbi:MAG: imidazolonepropionase [Gaiellales bacterium]|nr:imidazolonepropionase [Gaiellales bacterium]